MLSPKTRKCTNFHTSPQKKILALTSQSQISPVPILSRYEKEQHIVKVCPHYPFFLLLTYRPAFRSSVDLPLPKQWTSLLNTHVSYQAKEKEKEHKEKKKWTPRSLVLESLTHRTPRSLTRLCERNNTHKKPLFSFRTTPLAPIAFFQSVLTSTRPTGDAFVLR